MARRKPNVQHEAGAEPADEERGAGRARLLEATSILMRDADDLHVPLADIAAHTGLNAALVRYYFKGKDGLLRALLERDTGTSLTELDHLLAMDIKPSKKLRYHLAGLINTYHTYPYLSRLMIKLLQEGSEDERQKIADRFLKPIANFYETVVKEGRAIGEFRDIDPKLLYFNVIGMCDHLFSSRASLHYCYGIDEVDETLKRQYIDQVVTILLKGVLADEVAA